MARATADRALAHGLLKPELAETLLGVLADSAAGTGTTGGTDGGGSTPGHPVSRAGRGHGADGRDRAPRTHLTRTPPRASRNGAAR